MTTTALAQIPSRAPFVVVGDALKGWLQLLINRLDEPEVWPQVTGNHIHILGRLVEAAGAPRTVGDLSRDTGMSPAAVATVLRELPGILAVHVYSGLRLRRVRLRQRPHTGGQPGYAYYLDLQ